MKRKGIGCAVDGPGSFMVKRSCLPGPCQTALKAQIFLVMHNNKQNCLAEFLKAWKKCRRLIFLCCLYK